MLCLFSILWKSLPDMRLCIQFVRLFRPENNNVNLFTKLTERYCFAVAIVTLISPLLSPSRGNYSNVTITVTITFTW